MTAAWLWSRSEWRRRWPSLLLLAPLIALGAGVTIAAVAGARRADTAFDRFIAKTGEPDLGATFDFDRRGFDAELAARATSVFDRASRLPGVTAATSTAVWAYTPGPPLEPWQFGPVSVVGDAPTQFFVSGHAADPDDPAAVVLNELASRRLGVGVGDSFVLHTVGTDQAQEWADNEGVVDSYDGPDLTVEVAGIARGAEDIAQAEDATISVTPAFYRAHHDEVFNCVCFNFFRVDHRRLGEVTAQLRALYAPYAFVVEPQERGALPRQAADGIDVEVRALQLLALAAGLAAVLVVAQAMVRQAAETGGADDARRALGATRTQLVAAGSLVIAPAVVLGAAGAIGLALALSPLTPRGLAKQAEVDPGVRVDWPVVLLGAAAVIAIGTVLAVWAARTVVRQRGRRPARFAPLPGWLRPAPMMGVGFAVRPGRSRAAVWSSLVAIAVGVTGVLGVWSFESSRRHLLADPRLFGVDARLAYESPGDDPGAFGAAKAAVVADPRVPAVSILHSLDREITVSHDGRDTPINAEALEYVKGLAGTTIVSGRLPSSPSEVVIGHAVADAIGARIGDAVTVHGGAGDALLTVVGREVSWGTDDVVHGFHLTPDGLAALRSVVCGDDVSCHVDQSALVLRTVDGTEGRRVTSDLERSGWTPIEPPSVVGNLAQSGSVPVAFGAFLALLGFGGLAHGLVVTLRRGRRDVAIGRTLGFTRGDARSTVRWDAATLAAAGVAVGVPIGLVSGRVAWSIVASNLGVVVRHALPWWSFAAVAATVFVVALALSELPARRAGRLRPAEILRTE
jgi:hypothetical protein